MNRKFAEVQGHQVAYREQGSGPSLIMSHGLGFTNSADNWVPAMDRLSDAFRTVALDMVGWGWSDRPVMEYSFPFMRSTLKGFVDELGIPHAVLLGHTLGAWNSALVAAEYPDLVTALVLVNAAGLNPRAASPARQFIAPERDELRVALERMFNGSFPVTDDVVEDEVRRHDRAGVAEAYSNVLAFINDPVVRTSWSLRSVLPIITCPVLVVWGENDPVLGPEMGEEAVDLLPNGRLVLIADGEHIPMARKPEEFAIEVKKFLSDVGVSH